MQILETAKKKDVFKFYLGVVIDELQELPDENNRREDQIQNTEYENCARKLSGQIGPFTRHLELGPELIAVAEGCERSPEKQELKVVLEAGGEQNELLAENRHVELGRQKALVNHGHLVVLESQNAMVDVELG